MANWAMMRNSAQVLKLRSKCPAASIYQTLVYSSSAMSEKSGLTEHEFVRVLSELSVDRE